jgi:hypothetical protein
MPVCRVCSKAAKVTYDPLIPCNGCQRFYHDSCRKPALVEGADSYVLVLSRFFVSMSLTEGGIHGDALSV